MALLAVGKAATAMAAGAVRSLGDRVVRSLVIGPVDVPLDSRLHFVRGDHPVPGAGSERAGRGALALAASARDCAALLVLVSGGASALMAVPADGLTLADKQQATDALLRSGVTIHELNTVRKHLSAIKGGRLAAASPVPVFTLAISDVVGDDPAVIGSGPTAPDPTTFADALAIVRRSGGRARFCEAVVAHLERGAAGSSGPAETPKAADGTIAHSHWRLVGGRRDAMAAAGEEARRRGYRIHILDEPVVGEARVAATRWVEQLPQVDSPLCVISSGETTVRVLGEGQGGRNQEFALAAAEPLARWRRPAVLASVGTDGVDGPTDAAGAIARHDSLARARAAGLAPAEVYLASNNSYRFFDPLGDLIRTGPSGTNVGDLQVCLIN
jgi:glycerate 2-kinase